MPSWLTGLFGSGGGRTGVTEQGPTGEGISLRSPTALTTASPASGPHHQLSIIDDDDRVDVQSVTKKPWCAICYLECEFDNGKFTGTGWLIDARTVITAGHNVWNPPADPDEPDRAVGKVKRITVTPAQLDGRGGPFGSRVTNHFDHFVYDKRWEKEPYNDPARRYYDYGAILLNEPGFKLPFYFTPWAMPPEKWEHSMCLNCGGYPADLNCRFVTAAGNACSVSPGGSLFIGPNKEMVIHSTDTEGGESGGPIFWTDGHQYYVLAVHTQGVGLAPGFNAGVRITTKMIEAFDRWRTNPNRQGPQTVE
jgi:V8-like Glu-specific endopeptidase